MRFNGIAKKILVGALLGFGALFGQAVENQIDKPAFTKEVVSAVQGGELDQIKQSVDSKGIKSKATYATTLTDESLIQVAKEAVNSPNKVMIVCYTDQEGLHYGLVEAVDSIHSKVLVQPAGSTQGIWMDSGTLLSGMQSLNKDHCPNGYLTAFAPEET